MTLPTYVESPLDPVSPTNPKGTASAKPAEAPAIKHLKPPVDPESLAWRDLLDGPFWHKIPAWEDIDEATFLDHRWQDKHAITSPKKLVAALKDLVTPEFLADIEAGFHRAPMSVRISPYLLSLMDWSDPVADPLRRQFLPIASQLEPNHPMLTLDSLAEQEDSPVPGVTHRYPDKALFLVLDTCPVYCRFCTRSYAVGTDTDEVEKVAFKAKQGRWADAIRYFSERPELEDIVISGGDTYRLKASQVREVGHALLNIPHIRRMRFATKGPAVMPMKLLTDDAWVDALTEIVERGRKLHKDVVVHTHFNNANEITAITERAVGRLVERGIHLRNQTVLQRGVNDTPEAMVKLVKRLAYINVHPYYVFSHDLVMGCEDLRTSLDRAMHLEKRVRGVTAGYNTPTFVVDAPGGGGKRDLHSWEHYDRETGVSVYAAPAVKPGKFFLYFDPLRSLSPKIQADWADPLRQQEMVDAALAAAKRAR